MNPLLVWVLGTAVTSQGDPVKIAQAEDYLLGFVVKGLLWIAAAGVLLILLFMYPGEVVKWIKICGLVILVGGAAAPLKLAGAGLRGARYLWRRLKTAALADQRARQSRADRVEPRIVGRDQ